MLMKKILVCTLAIVLALSTLATPCDATSLGNSEVVYLEDGSYIVTSLEVSKTSRSSSVRGSKSSRYYSASDVLQWTVVLTGTFTYNSGVSASCTSATCDVEILDSAWSCSSKSASTSGASAIGNAEIIQKFLFVTIYTVPVSIMITCDTYGNLS